MPYILIVLLIGGTIGFFVGRDSNPVKDLVPETLNPVVSDTDSIRKVFERQKEAYRLHDALLLLRDCSDFFIEIDGHSIPEIYNAFLESKKQQNPIAIVSNTVFTGW